MFGHAAERWSLESSATWLISTFVVLIQSAVTLAKIKKRGNVPSLPIEESPQNPKLTGDLEKHTFLDEQSYSNKAAAIKHKIKRHTTNE
jgi:hypothetical protein